MIFSILILILVFSAAGANFSASEESVVMTVDVEKATLSAGDDFVFKIMINNLPDVSSTKIRSFNIDLAYNDMALEITEVIKGDIPSDNFLSNKSISGEILTGDYKVSQYENGTIFFTVRGKVKENAVDGNYTISIVKARLWDENNSGKPYPVTVKNSSINVETAKIAKDAAVAEAIKAIEAIGSTDSGHETRVVTARELVEKAMKLGAIESEFTNMGKLLEAEEIYKHGFVVGTIGLPFDYKDGVTVEIILNGRLLGQKSFDNTTGQIVLNYGDFRINDFDSANKPSLIVKAGPNLYKAVMPGTISVKDKSAENSVEGVTDVLNIGNIELVSGNSDSGNSTIDFADVVKTKNGFMKVTSDRSLDLNGDGVVNVKDMFYVNHNFGY